MAKVRRKDVMSSLQAAARLSRTTLAARLLAHGFYAGQEQIMLMLDSEDGLTPGELSKRLGVRPPTVTKTINRLQAQGHVDKRDSQSDARQAHVFLTESGRNAIREIEKAMRKADRLAFEGFDKKERKLLFNLLGRVEANLTEQITSDGRDEEDAQLTDQTSSRSETPEPV